jgi:hypothetical protein
MSQVKSRSPKHHHRTSYIVPYMIVLHHISYSTIRKWKKREETRTRKAQKTTEAVRPPIFLILRTFVSSLDKPSSVIIAKRAREIGLYSFKAVQGITRSPSYLHRRYHLFHSLDEAHLSPNQPIQEKLPW